MADRKPLSGDPMDTPPVDHGSDRFDYIEVVDAPEGTYPAGTWFEQLAAAPCPDCRANLFLRWTGLSDDPLSQLAWRVTIAHDETCPMLATINPPEVP